MNKVLNLIILGPQGSGKDTQGQLLAKKFNLIFLGAGNLLRKIAQSDSELGRRVKQRIDAGLLVEPEDIALAIAEKVKQIPREQGLIFESFPRSVTQYELMKNFWPKLGRGDFAVIFIDLSETEAVNRLSQRVMCQTCGRIYIKGQFAVCPNCGGKLAQRHDDYPEAIKNRLGWFKSETLPMIAAMEKDGRQVVRIDGAPPVSEVHAAILKALNLG